MRAEYQLPVDFEQTRFELARWVTSEDKTELERFMRTFPSAMATISTAPPVFMAPSAWSLRHDQENGRR